MTTLQASAQKQLRQLVEQIERLEEEKKALAGDIRDKYLEAKGLGFDVKVLRQVVRLRKKSATERNEEDAVLEVYLHALGMLRRAGRGDDRRRVRARSEIAQILLIGFAERGGGRLGPIRRSAETPTASKGFPPFPADPAGEACHARGKALRPKFASTCVDRRGHKL